LGGNLYISRGRLASAKTKHSLRGLRNNVIVVETTRVHITRIKAESNPKSKFSIKMDEVDLSSASSKSHPDPEASPSKPLNTGSQNFPLTHAYSNSYSKPHQIPIPRIPLQPSSPISRKPVALPSPQPYMDAQPEAPTLRQEFEAGNGYEENIGRGSGGAKKSGVAGMFTTATTQVKEYASFWAQHVKKGEMPWTQWYCCGKVDGVEVRTLFSDLNLGVLTMMG
jgi:hypothetical protein